MISFLASLAAGNAVQIFVAPLAGAIRWRILRKRTNDINTADDPAANLIHDGTDTYVVDSYLLANGTEYFYRAFYLIGADWVASDARSVTPDAQFADIQADVLDIVRDRIDLGFAVRLQKGQITNAQDHIPVLLATPPLEDVIWPMVSVHLTDDSQAERFVGEELIGGIGDLDTGEGIHHDGWLSRYQIFIICWCSNGDMRKEMRKLLKSVVMSNLQVFEYEGMSQVEVKFSDSDDVNTYPMPVYQATCTLTCIAPSSIETRSTGITDVVVTST